MRGRALAFIAQKPKKLRPKSAPGDISVGAIFLPVAQPLDEKWAQQRERTPFGVVALTVGKFMRQHGHLYAWRQVGELGTHVDALVPET